jgi:hypothetical protein
MLAYMNDASNPQNAYPAFLAKPTPIAILYSVIIAIVLYSVESRPSNRASQSCTHHNIIYTIHCYTLPQF